MGINDSMVETPTSCRLVNRFGKLKAAITPIESTIPMIMSALVSRFRFGNTYTLFA